MFSSARRHFLSASTYIQLFMGLRNLASSRKSPFLFQRRPTVLLARIQFISSASSCNPSNIQNTPSPWTLHKSNRFPTPLQKIAISSKYGRLRLPPRSVSLRNRHGASQPPSGFARSCTQACKYQVCMCPCMPPVVMTCPRAGYHAAKRTRIHACQLSSSHVW